METLLDWIAAVPDVIWSGVIASVITLGGVMLSNWSNTRRLVRQLGHDANEKQKDRNAVLRREVYLTAVEEFVRASHKMGTLSQIDPTKSNFSEGFQDFFVVAAKLQLVSNASTARLVGELVTTYGEVLLEMIGIVQPIHDVQADIAIADEAYARYVEESRRVLTAITQFRESARTESAVYEALQRSFEFSQEQANKHSQARLTLRDQQTAMHFELTKSLMPILKRIAEVQAPVMVAIRQELDLDGDVGDFRRQAADNILRMDSAMNAAVQKMEQANN
ncbi:hypothetical protein [Lysobacter sp. cf310]|uniref:hypothetical protein n=1 Tax=Lysobacter sp. cf310 TaxID=1761790 RepID=UPI0008E240BA|nr:hypothetical protein [Lysobacter sp. cf310]SFL05670.1 hypothetical protein SAMN04487938_3024 [Lysobacter sp. cf310]